MAGLFADCTKKEKPTNKVFVPRLVGSLDTSRLAIIDLWNCGLQCEMKSKRVDELCDEILPEDGKIWFMRPDGQVCSCSCTELWEFPLGMRDSAYYRLLQSEKRRAFRSDLVLDPASRTLKRLANYKLSYRDCVAVVMPEPSCSDEYLDNELELWSLRNVFYQHFPYFNIEIHNTSDDFPSSVPYTEYADDGTATSASTIIFPCGFLEHPDVGWELVAFCLAHEIGHLLAPTVPCNSNGGTVSESEADYWAALVGLRRAFPGSLYTGVAANAAAQLYAYMSDPDVDSTPECGAPWCSSDCDLNPEYPTCGYPPRLCRWETIIAGLQLDAKPTCTSNWYCDSEGCAPVSCADQECP